MPNNTFGILSISQNLTDFIGDACELPVLIADDIHFFISFYGNGYLLLLILMRIQNFKHLFQQKSYLYTSLTILFIMVYMVYDVFAVSAYMIPVVQAKLTFISIGVGLMDLRGLIADFIIGFYFFQIFYLIRDIKALKGHFKFNAKPLVIYLGVTIVLLLIAVLLFVFNLSLDFRERGAGLVVPTWVGLVSSLFHSFANFFIVVYVIKYARNYKIADRRSDTINEFLKILDSLLLISLCFFIMVTFRTIQQFSFVYITAGLVRQYIFGHMRSGYALFLYISLGEIIKSLFGFSVLYPIIGVDTNTMSRTRKSVDSKSKSKNTNTNQ